METGAIVDIVVTIAVLVLPVLLGFLAKMVANTQNKIDDRVLEALTDWAVEYKQNKPTQ